MVGGRGFFKAIVVEWALDNSAVGGDGAMGWRCGVKSLWGGDCRWDGGEWARCGVGVLSAYDVEDGFGMVRVRGGDVGKFGGVVA